MEPDEIMQEVRNARTKLQVDWGGTIESIHKNIMELDQKYSNRLVTKEMLLKDWNKYIKENPIKDATA